MYHCIISHAACHHASLVYCHTIGFRGFVKRTQFVHHTQAHTRQTLVRFFLMLSSNLRGHLQFVNTTVGLCILGFQVTLSRKQLSSGKRGRVFSNNSDNQENNMVLPLPYWDYIEILICRTKKTINHITFSYPYHIQGSISFSRSSFVARYSRLRNQVFIFDGNIFPTSVEMQLSSIVRFYSTVVFLLLLLVIIIINYHLLFLLLLFLLIIL